MNAIRKLLLFSLTLAALFIPSALWAQGTAFTYQGRLNDGASPADGIYDLRFAIYDLSSGGSQQGAAITNIATSISNGLFTVTLDFGNQFPGAERWLEIGVRPNGGGAFSTLTPRQQITATPYAMQSENANSAGTITGTITPANVAAGTITGVMLANGAVGSNQLALGSVGTAQLAAGTLAAPASAASPTLIATANTSYVITNSGTTAVILPTSANVGDVIQITGHGAGGWSAFTPGEDNWVQSSAPTAFWKSVATSADGSRLAAAVSGGGIWTSADHGVTWTQSTAPSAFWTSVAASADASRLAAVAWPGGIWTSTNFGVNWTLTSAPTEDWRCIAASANGNRLVAGFGVTSDLYVSTNFGVNWTPYPSPNTEIWFSVASSADGSHLVGVTDDGRIVTSTNFGMSWTFRYQGPSWNSVASSADGSRLAVAPQGFPPAIWTSADFGVNWTSNSVPGSVRNVASSADGSRLVAAGNGGIFTSTDFGATWTSNSVAGSNWQSVASAADGNLLAAVAFNGGIYLNKQAVSSGAPGASGTLQYVGNGQWAPVTITPSSLPPNAVTNDANGVNLAGTFSGNPSTHLLGTTLSTSNSYEVAVADFNGDGWSDLVSSGTNGFSVFTNNRAGGFAPLTNIIFTAWSSVGLAAVDLNGDGRQDFIGVLHLSPPCLLAYTNTGSGSFGLASSNSAASGGGSAVGDVNGDGKVDVLLGTYVNGFTSIYFNDGAGGFPSGTGVQSTYHPDGVVAADVNGDGSLDVITVSSSPFVVDVFTNNGAGSFSPKTSYAIGTGLSSDVTAADVNGDGWVDIVTANQGGSVSVLTNNRSGIFALAGTYPVGVAPWRVLARDLTGDGRPELITANYTDASLSILQNNGAGGFTLASAPSVGGRPNSLAAGDVNGDAQPELITANFNNTLSILFHTPVFTGSFAGNGAALTALNAASLTGTIASNNIAANTIGSSQIANGTIVNADISASASIADTKLATISTAGKVADTALSGNVSLLGQTIESGEITDGTIVNADISSSAAIAYSKLNLANGIVNADVSPSAAIADTKLATISTAGKVADTALSVNVTKLGSTIESSEIADGTILNADINASAAIADSKLATISTAGKVANAATTATSANTANAIVARDASGNFTAGTVTATTFSGSGVSLTSLNASQLTGGTVADARLSANVAVLAANPQTFTGSNNFASTMRVGTRPLADGQTVQMRVVGDSGSWKGSAAFGHSNAAVILGETSSTATIGGHSSTLGAWANLAINPGGGNVGIGTFAPANRLTVSGDANFTGEVGIGTATPSAPLHVATAASVASILHSSSTAGTWAGIVNTAGGETWQFVSTGSGNVEGAGKLLMGWDKNPGALTGIAMTLVNNGRVGIGTVSPVNPLSVAGNADVSGNLGVGTGSPTARLSVNGGANNTTGAWGIFSDRRLKKHIEPMAAGSLDRMLKLEGVTFEYTQPELHEGYDGTYRGWIAQQVAEVFPEWVTEAPNGMKMVTPVGFDALAVEALRELRTEKDAQVAKLAAENADLKARLEKIEQLLEHRLNGGNR